MDGAATINELAKALATAQGQFTHAVKDSKNPHYGNKYADLASVWDAIRGPLAANGLSVTQITDIADTGVVVLITRLMHSSGQWIDSRYPLLPTKPDPQGYGSAMTYARRYCLAAIVGIAQDDDDGNAASDRSARSAVKAAKQSPTSARQTPVPTAAQAVDGEINEGTVLDFETAIIDADTLEALDAVGVAIAQLPQQYRDILKPQYAAKLRQLKETTQ